VIDRDVEHAVHLRRVQRHRHDPVSPGGLQQLRDEARADRDPRGVLLVRAGVREVRDHCGDLCCRRATGGIDHQQELDEVLLHRRHQRLDDEDVALTTVVAQLDLQTVVGEPCGARRRDLGPEDGADLLGELPMCRTREDGDVTHVARE